MSDGQGSVSFVQYLLPALDSGDYTLTATQAISVQGQGESLRAAQAFFVAGLRYQLDDSGVDSVFPPPGSQGDFSGALPHVVLTDPTLPWQRSPETAAATGPDAAARRAGAASGDPVPSWLAVLLFDEQDPPPRPRDITIGDLAGGGGVFFPPRTEGYGEKPTDPVTVIDVPVDLYARITPSLADLNWLAHTRITEPAAKAASADTPPASEFAAVFGSRLPVVGRTSAAFLVSLEGYGRYLPKDDGTGPGLPAGTTAVRLVVLRTWTFYTSQLQQTFQGLLQAVDMSPATLRLPVVPDSLGGTDVAVDHAFGMGYTAMNHGLRGGGATVSWYRGPLLPLGAAAPPVTQSQASDQLLRYDPDSGMFDVSYAAAWELGRLLALHDRAFATALFRWKLTVTQQAAAQLEEEIVDQLLPPLPASQAGDESLAPAHRRLARAIRDVVGPAADRIAGRAGPNGANGPTGSTGSTGQEAG